MNIFFVSLGCDKNLVDSERMLGILNENGYRITDNEENADIIIVNTCCFINDAKEESITTILEMAQYKVEGNLKALIVAGCLAERYKEEILKEIPEVDALLGTSSFPKIIEVINNLLEDGQAHAHFDDLERLPGVGMKRLLSAGSHYAYLKIAEGCDKHCTYCVIPKVRGNYRSVPIEELIKEAEYLADQGVKELILVAQETTLYGQDIYQKKALPELLKKLSQIEGISWIRILYCYPEEITDELIDVIKNEPKVCHYLDIPIQHASDNILKKMGRRTNQQDLVKIINKLRDNIPDIVLRTTLISGFPGETEEDHEELMEFVETMKFDRLGVFTYSKEEDTPAAKMKPQVDEKVKQQRQKEIMELQQEIVFAKAQEMIGHSLDVLIEGKLTDEENVYIGRTYMDAPQVDGYIFISSDEELLSGDMIKATVTAAKDYDLVGDLVKGSVRR
jgi:ribosomal protein S12 methylthiotransferase